MNEELIAKIQQDPNYIMLRRKRNRLSILLTIIVFIVYYGWIALIAFDKEFLATRIGNGVTTIAIPIGLATIITMVVLTAIYVFIANNRYDKLINKLKEDVGQ